MAVEGGAGIIRGVEDVPRRENQDEGEENESKT